MTIAGILFVDLFGLMALMAIVLLLKRRLLSIGLGATWISLIILFLFFVTIPPLRGTWIHFSALLFQSPPYLIALTLFLTLFLLYLSVVVSVLQRRVREISQFVSLENVKD